MVLKKFTSLDGFYVVDIPEADTASGPMRSAPKILQGGAADLARSQSYTYAALEMARSGAAGGINADPDDRAAAVAAFVGEIAPLVQAGTFLPDAAKGVNESELASLRAGDPRATERFGADNEPGLVEQAEAVGVVTAAAALLDGLDGRTVAIDGFGATGPDLVAEAIKQGAKVVAISSGAGTITRAEGFEPDTVDWSGADEPAWKVFATECDVLFSGSKMGAIDHVGAEKLKVKAVVPSGQLAYTARALAIFGRSDIATVPDFVSLAGSTIAMWAETDMATDKLLADVSSTVGSLINGARSHDKGIFVGACERAETFMRGWVETMPFGRPLGS